VEQGKVYFSTVRALRRGFVRRDQRHWRGRGLVGSLGMAVDEEYKITIIIFIVRTHDE